MAHSPPAPPPLHSYWFYTSSLSLDDPLAPVPTAGQNTVKQPQRPFSQCDSTALETAYQELLCDHRRIKNTGRDTPKRSTSPRPPSRLHQIGPTRTREVALQGHPVWNTMEDELQARDEIPPTTVPADSPRPHLSALKRSASPSKPHISPSSVSNNNVGYAAGAESTAVNTTPTRNPFIRSFSLSRSSAVPINQNNSQNSSRRSSISRSSIAGTKKSTVPTNAPPPLEKAVPVGIQRLHKVLLPSFVMTPIYWSPLHDVSSVVRGTWFYKDTMLPVETEVANRLETGWEEVCAWTEEWEMELSSAVEVGREGEEKVRWKLWDPNSISAPSSRPCTAAGGAEEQTLVDTLPESVTKTAPAVSNPNDASSRAKPNLWDWVLFTNARDAYICRDTMLSFGNKRPLANVRRGKTMGTHVVRGFSEKEWLRLHPPRKRPPPASPRNQNGCSGISRTTEKNTRSYSSSNMKQIPRTTVNEFQAGGDLCSFAQHQDDGLGLGENQQERGKVTDLFLVIHGIGQKLSERVESFHFTHAINSFRRMLNVELRNETVRPHLRDDVGIMVLPINWRHNLTFEDGIDGSASGEDTSNLFSLNDITPPTIPAVRNLIGDVMLDIPYYLSHHKDKMVKAVIAEANRVYGLWCTNNPGFEKQGRVHIIAHSLGTAIAMDILTKQPTHTIYDPKPSLSSGSGAGKRCSRELDLQNERFDFDTINIFFCGSPAGFFLLLNRSMLLPRRGRNKPGTFGEDKEPGVGGEAGKYGCMAVDNVYNVLHCSDPIAYRLNPTVDPEYASTVRTAYVPSTTSSFLGTISSTLRSVLPGTSTSQDSASPFNTAPAQRAMPRLPSNIELETHDFSREELAEKRLFLLNDNGQIDWYLSVMKPLENQYLNMLGAHSSYWESRDFARMLVVEVGRQVGKSGTVRAMRVQKKRGFLWR